MPAVQLMVNGAVVHAVVSEVEPGLWYSRAVEVPGVEAYADTAQRALEKIAQRVQYAREVA